MIRSPCFPFHILISEFNRWNSSTRTQPPCSPPCCRPNGRHGTPTKAQEKHNGLSQNTSSGRSNPLPTPKNPHLSSTYPAFPASPSPCLEATFAPPTVQEGGASWRLPARSRWPRTCPRYVPSCRSCCGSWGKPCPFLMHIRWTSTRSLCGRNWLICPQRRCCRRSGPSRRRQRRAP